MLRWTRSIFKRDSILILRRQSSNVPNKTSSEELQEARKWLAQLKPEGIVPSRVCEVSFSRSSGPGGQNVNKVSSKATLRVPLEELLTRAPPLLHQCLRESRYFAVKTNSLVIQSDDSRKQGDNEVQCFRKLYDDIVESASKVLPGETSEAQKAKVIKLQKADNENRIRAKKQHSSKKAGRRPRSAD